ncbi:hypothetical protein JCM10207_001137 [Rhodosporidiobolus poonsookiae]
MSPPSLRFACLQFSPVLKDPAASMEKADRLLERLQPGSLDVLMLPEMAFTGYCFKSRDDVAPFVEDPETGFSAEWARKTARRLQCYVLVGAPTLGPSAPDTPPSAQPSFFNSLLVFSPTGALLHKYSKHFLYETDETWATPGPSFLTVDLPFPPSSPFHGEGKTFRAALAICMDINPYRFEAPFDAFEFGTFAEREKAEVVLALMAWLDSEPPVEGEETDGEGEGWDAVRRTLGYWAMRTGPLLGSRAALVCANRNGREGETVFTGSSCAIELSDPPAVVAYAGKRREELVQGVVRLRRGDNARGDEAE